MARPATFVVPILFLATLAGCATAPRSPFDPASGAGPTAIRHVVLAKLVDPADAPELIAQLDRDLSGLPSITSYWRGTRVPSDRPEVRDDFDVGMVVDFADTDAYRAYVNDPKHLALVKAWKPRSSSLLIYDIASRATAGSKAAAAISR